MLDFQPILQGAVDSASFWVYPLILFFVAIEGPFATLIAAFFASMGFFDIYLVYLMSVLGDIISDVIIYYFGKRGGRPLFKKIEKRFNVKKSLLKKADRGFKKYGNKFVFFAKATTGLSFMTILLAGVTRMKFKSFLLYSTLGGVVWSGFLVIIGYFFGSAAEQISQEIKGAGLVVFIFTIVALAVVFTYQKRKSLKNNNDN